jgi:hypothetical protein
MNTPGSQDCSEVKTRGVETPPVVNIPGSRDSTAVNTAGVTFKVEQLLDYCIKIKIVS